MRAITKRARTNDERSGHAHALGESPSQGYPQPSARVREGLGRGVFARTTSGEISDAADGDESENDAPGHPGSFKLNLAPDEGAGQGQEDGGQGETTHPEERRKRPREMPRPPGPSAPASASSTKRPTTTRATIHRSRWWRCQILGSAAALEVRFRAAVFFTGFFRCRAASHNPLTY